MKATTSLASSLRSFFRLFTVVSAIGTGLALTAVVQGAVDGPRWLLMLGLPVTALALTAFGRVAEDMKSGVAPGLRSGGPRAFAPAVVNGVQAVNKENGRPATDGQAVKSVFAFDLTVLTDDLPPYRIEVRHPLDLQGLLHRSRAVVEYDPEQPWRVVIPNNPPREWLARANSLTPPTAEVKRRGGGVPAGFRALVSGVVIAAVLLVLVRVLG
ncbi:hypothetical protein OG978_04980 [Streptomyces sp. NBC_01591]|uniref:hypothetical protein n=1 Tax=Streptomyces sp. NBC_01591 TaxID=2975888 RepID=UPI002DDA188D|nr:hypothetical protein [Streptomyces sp. NBC_01591]WSD66792.1 hypothetical protein OG978_04980 [Streptomyces sp. NBC_01591]